MNSFSACIPELDLFYCPGGTVTEPDVVCIYGSHQCDGIMDCVGGEDEVCKFLFFIGNALLAK